MGRTRRPWLDKDKQEFVDLVNEGNTLQQISDKIGRSMSAVTNRYYIYLNEGCYKDDKRILKKWTTDDINTLLIMYKSGYAMRDISKELGRSRMCVYSRWKRLYEAGKVYRRSW